MNTTTTNPSFATLTGRRPRRRLSRAAAAGATGLVMACATQLPAFAHPDTGSIDTGSSAPWRAAPAVARIGGLIVRCDTGEGNLGGAGVLPPLTLPEVTTCNPGRPSPAPASAYQARQLEHDPLR
jgi:hypothetical protein